LHSGNASDQTFASSVCRIDAKLHAGISAEDVVQSGYVISAILPSGAASQSALLGAWQISSKLQAGFGTSDLLHSEILASFWGTNGVFGSSDTGGRVIMGFKDPFLNARALTIRSATEQLYLVTPLEDI
jgi:hypothetical protein